MRLLLPDGAPSLTLLVSQIKSAARVWVNGRPMFSVGTVGRDAATEVPLPLTRFLTLPAGPTTADLAIEVSNHFHFEGGINRSIMLDGNR